MGQLRITSGTLRNRRIEVPETGAVRPMLEKPRMAIFSILGQDCVDGAGMIDCFAGTGILAFEAISRGAAMALAFDVEPKHHAAIVQAAVRLGVSDQLQAIASDVMNELVPRGAAKEVPHSMRKLPLVKLAVVDPPHAVGADKSHRFHEWFSKLGDLPGLAHDCVIVYGHHADLEPPERSGRMLARDTRQYGEVAITLYWEPQL